MSSAEPAAGDLLVVYLEKRPALVRFFTARLGSSAAAEDLVQDIYLKLASAPPDVGSPSAFLYRLGYNLMLDRVKQQRRAAARDGAWRSLHRSDLGGEDLDASPPVDQAVADRQRLAKLMRGLEHLPPQCRRAFELHKFDGLSHSETAAALGISRSAVEKHVSSALRKLLAWMDGDGR